MSVLYFSAPPLPYYINSGESRFKPGESHPSRSHIGLFDLLVVHQGALFMGEEERGWTVSEGQALLLQPDRHHYPLRPVDSETQFFWLHFQTNALWSDQPWHTEAVEEVTDDSRQYRDEQGLTPRAFGFSIPQYFTLRDPTDTYSRLRELIELEKQPLSWARWQQQIQLQSLLKALAEGQDEFGQSPAVRLAERVAVHLRTHYRSSVTHELLQREFNFHPVYIARCMKKALGCSPLEYLTRYRIEQAKLLMLGTTLSIEEIAWEVGFRHQTFFSRTFRKLERMSPSEFRKQFNR
ncbi:helix-turn-helix transcriptional regulator [Cohnella soli]|uniref:Helix-turn-helix transcriptional regulator n=1 Tax=Cohnella soli TaxID=425005 RepID=A0ABW0HND8_9BACL